MMLCPEWVSVMCTAPGASAASSFWAAEFVRSTTAPKSGGVSGGSSPAWMSFGTTSMNLSLAVSTTTGIGLSVAAAAVWSRVLIEILAFQIRVGRERLGRTGVDALPGLPLLWCHLGAKLGREDVNEHNAFDFVRVLTGEDPCDCAAERVCDEDVRARHVGRLQQGDEIVDPVLRTGRLGHGVAAAEGLVEMRCTGSVVGAHSRRLLNVVVDRRTLLIRGVPQVRRRVRARDEQHGGRSAAMTLDIHHPSPTDVDPFGEGLRVRRCR